MDEATNETRLGGPQGATLSTKLGWIQSYTYLVPVQVVLQDTAVWAAGAVANSLSAVRCLHLTCPSTSSSINPNLAAQFASPLRSLRLRRRCQGRQ